jgi:uncharacterized protein with HEPN domain
MSKRRDKEYLSDIIEAIERIAQYAEGLAYSDFIQDKKTQDAVVRNLEVIGEAAKGITGALKKRYPEIPWSDMAKLRDRLAHHYFGINYEIVWNIVSKELPSVHDQLASVLAREFE